MTPDEQPKTTGTCFLCEVNPVTAEDFCHGCHQSICSECAEGDMNLPFGGHEPEDHLGEEEDDE